ncbi:efflux RND transporter permease subunit, partial [Salmonella enterica subsp. enterica serovar Typhimurium]|nr:efflux RND transporter permease subunit [Salmonella enterica subsp. enterica serovar Typhimurium]
DGVSLGEAVDAVESVRAQLGMPATMTLKWEGAAEAFRASLSDTLWLILAAVVTMYIVLGVLYESYVHPLTILSTLPSAAIGALLALLVFYLYQINRLWKVLDAPAYGEIPSAVGLWGEVYYRLHRLVK